MIHHVFDNFKISANENAFKELKDGMKDIFEDLFKKGFSIDGWNSRKFLPLGYFDSILFQPSKIKLVQAIVDKSWRYYWRFGKSRLGTVHWNLLLLL